MAQADLTTSPVLRPAAPKAKMTIYFALLIIALLAMLIGCLYLWLEIRRFGGFGAISGRVAAVVQPAGALVADATPAVRGSHAHGT